MTVEITHKDIFPKTEPERVQKLRLFVNELWFRMKKGEPIDPAFYKLYTQKLDELIQYLELEAEQYAEKLELEEKRDNGPSA